MEPFEGDILECGTRADQTCGVDGEFHKASCYNKEKLVICDKQLSEPIHADSEGHHRYCQCAECYRRYGP